MIATPGILQLDAALRALVLLLTVLLPASVQARTLHFAADTESPQPLTIYGVVDPPQVRPLLADFHRRNPDIAIAYHNLETLALHARVLQERGAPRADVVMSPAMPWQYQLANEGLSTPVDSPAAAAWPSWARWRQELFGFTFEPIVMVYRRDLVRHMPPPQSHAELLKLLQQQPEALSHRVVTYDPRRSGAGYTYAIEDARISARYWDLVEALGKTHSALETTTAAMLEGLSDGRYWIGYNLIGSYVQDYVAKHPELVMVVPKDYALVLQRLVMISRDAPHPATARRFVEYLLSAPAQRLLATQTTLGAVHPSIDGIGTAADLRERLGEAIRPVQIGPGLLATLDTLKRQTLLEQWQQAFKNHSTYADGPLADPSPLPQTPQE
ncbi:ABC transporter substrate-binding protein [Salinicola socius]|uniref:ABC transporter substrate-binding protein n=1 Tax=Salinicola socius TaxID=404433 RepID=A0A1Q8SQM8_9GAMM|nr:extracellular solute-binding protein [Salinicola socius]OLO03726.1 ABC transporter substrate-binding protein [Salinicola socius]